MEVVLILLERGKRKAMSKKMLKVTGYIVDGVFLFYFAFLYLSYFLWWWMMFIVDPPMKANDLFFYNIATVIGGIILWIYIQYLYGHDIYQKVKIISLQFLFGVSLLFFLPGVAIFLYHFEMVWFHVVTARTLTLITTILLFWKANQKRKKLFTKTNN